MAVQLVTGVAGFIGSHLAERLLELGHRVRGIDSFTPYYSRRSKEINLSSLRRFNNFEFLEVDLRSGDLAPCFGDVNVVFHQAAQPGVRRSWADGFSEYVSCNIQVTQRLLEAARVEHLQRFVYASSSSVYGDAVSYPSMETDLPRPYSPYGVTKLAGEHLCRAYAANYGVPTVSLRYFTVYGPRQRPDMAAFRLIEAALGETTFPLYGDGNHRRDFTFISDVIAANIAASTTALEPGTVLNICGGGSTTMLALIDAVSEAVGRPPRIDRRPDQAGDVRRTGGSAGQASLLLGWEPLTTLQEGVAAQVAWHRSRSG